MSSDNYYREQYNSRINRVMDYIEVHISDPITLEELAEVAAFQRFCL